MSSMNIPNYMCCGRCECPCSYDEDTRSFSTGPCKNPICPTFTEQCYLADGFPVTSEMLHPDSWGAPTHTKSSNTGLLCDKVPEYGSFSLGELMKHQDEKQARADNKAITKFLERPGTTMDHAYPWPLSPGTVWPTSPGKFYVKVPEAQTHTCTKAPAIKKAPKKATKKAGNKKASAK
jgi:hypothetical protein